MQAGKTRAVIAAGAIGNVLEWYDFAIYGYFATSIPLDEYNTEFVTVNRGANAILFGIGSPAGVVDTTIASASFNKNSSKFVHRFGDTGSNRASLSLNE